MEHVFFENIKTVLIDHIYKAEQSIKVVSCYFSDSDLFNALCSAARRGLNVELVISDEPSNTFESSLDFNDLLDAQGLFFIVNRNENSTLVHHKFCIIDDKIVITGSFNWTKRASTNRENIIISNNKITAEKYRIEFEFVKENYSKDFKKWNDQTISSGFSGLDQIITGFWPGELITVLSAPQMGKSDFVKNILINSIVNHSFPCGYISSKHKKEDTYLSILSSASGLNFNKLRKGELSDLDWVLYHENDSFLQNSNLLIHEGEVEIHQLMTNCKALWYSGARVVFIDNVDRFFSGNYRSEGNQKDKDTMQKFKSLARLLRIPIILISNVSDTSENVIEWRNDPKLYLIGPLATYADTVLSPYRLDFYELGRLDTEYEVVRIKVLKHYFGSLGSIDLKYNRQTGKMEDFLEDVF